MDENEATGKMIIFVFVIIAFLVIFGKPKQPSYAIVRDVPFTVKSHAATYCELLNKKVGQEGTFHVEERR